MKTQLTKKIFLQNIRNVSDLKAICVIADRVTDFFHHVEKHEGRKMAILLHKEAERHIKNRILGIPSTFNHLRWVSLTKGGLPKKIISDKEMTVLMKNSAGKQGLMTVLAYYRLYRLPPSDDLSTVTDPSRASADCETLMDDIVDYFRPTKRFSLSDESILYVTSKAGASGPRAMGETSKKDMSALINEGIAPSLTALAKLVFTPEKFKELLEIINKLISDGLPEPGIATRLHTFSEGGGKTRIICIPDIWSQMVLKPIHEFLMDRLRRMPGDGTFSHSKVATQLRQKTESQGYICYDLTAVTDRLPVLLQEKLLAKLISKEVASWWRILIVERDLHYKGKTLRYSVGQPMGFLSSWPMMAITHHAIIQYSLRDVKDKSYFVIGDDMAMSSEEGALEYKRIIEALGCEINLSKSIPSKRTRSGEIAKRVFSNGLEISPIPPKLLVEATGSALHFLELVREVGSRVDQTPESLRFISDLGIARLLQSSRVYSSPEIHIFGSIPFIPKGTTAIPIAGVMDMWEGIYGANHRWDQFVLNLASTKIVELTLKVTQRGGSHNLDNPLLIKYRGELIEFLSSLMNQYNTVYSDDEDDDFCLSPLEVIYEVMSRPDPDDLQVFLKKTQVREQKALTIIVEFWKSLTYQDPNQVLTSKLELKTQS